MTCDQCGKLMMWIGSFKEHDCFICTVTNCTEQIFRLERP